MWVKLVRWNRRRLFNKAYKILRNEAEWHKKAGHAVWFSAVNEAHFELRCVNCPDLQPIVRKTNG